MYFLRDVLYFLINFINKFILFINKVESQGVIINGLLHLVNKGSLVIRKNVRINSGAWTNPIGGDTKTLIMVRPGASMVIGENVGISNSTLYCMGKIEIGDNTLIGGSCRIWDSDFHPLDPKERLKNPNDGYKTKPIFIGSNVFVGAGSIILKGTQIGDNSIIGAGSVVNGIVPSNQIWAGNPACYIKNL